MRCANERRATINLLDSPNLHEKHQTFCCENRLSPVIWAKKNTTDRWTTNVIRHFSASILYLFMFVFELNSFYFIVIVWAVFYFVTFWYQFILHMPAVSSKIYLWELLDLFFLSCLLLKNFWINCYLISNFKLSIDFLLRIS